MMPNLVLRPYAQLPTTVKVMLVLSVVGDILSWQGTFGPRTMRLEEQLVLGPQ